MTGFRSTTARECSIAMRDRVTARVVPSWPERGARSRLVTAEEFGNIIVRARPDGSLVKVRDVARGELGAKDYSVQARFNGQPSAAFGVSLTPDASALSVSDGVRATLEQLSRNFPPYVSYQVVIDQTVFVRVSLQEVLKTLAASSPRWRCRGRSTCGAATTAPPRRRARSSSRPRRVAMA